MGGWRLERRLSLAAELKLEAARREVPRLHPHEVHARLDSLLVRHAELQCLFRQAMMRVGELELRAAIAEPPPPWPIRIWHWIVRR
jgi:hypothetical protein